MGAESARWSTSTRTTCVSLLTAWSAKMVQDEALSKCRLLLFEEG